tara:strand:- start:6387 stop:6644 length:258 start_codon:yes stop_codon:yes gene_type:complete
MYSEPKDFQDNKIPTKRPTSPTLFNNIAFMAAFAARILVNQNPINKNEQSPTPSQPINKTIKLLDVTKIIIKNVKRERYPINLGK